MVVRSLSRSIGANRTAIKDAGLWVIAAALICSVLLVLWLIISARFVSTPIDSEMPPGGRIVYVENSGRLRYIDIDGCVYPQYTEYGHWYLDRDREVVCHPK